MQGRVFNGGLKKRNIPLILLGWAPPAALTLKSRVRLSSIKSMGLPLLCILMRGKYGRAAGAQM